MRSLPVEKGTQTFVSPFPMPGSHKAWMMSDFPSRDGSRRKRLAVLAALVCLIAVAPVDGSAGKNVSDRTAVPVKADARNGDGAPPSASIGLPAGPGENAEHCPDVSARNGPEICAQWVAANAARDAAEASATSLKWSIAAFVALLLSLGATAWAALVASRAAAAAEKTVLIAEDASGKQLRPYVSFFTTPEDDEKPAEFRKGGKLVVRIKNFGQTPALNVKLQSGSESRTWPIGSREVPLDDDDLSLGNLSPGQEGSISFRFDMVEDTTFTAVEAGEVVFVCRMRLEYDIPSGGQGFDERLIGITDAHLREGLYGLWLTPEGCERERIGR